MENDKVLRGPADEFLNLVLKWKEHSKVLSVPSLILTWSLHCQSLGIFTSLLPSTGSTSSLLLVQVTGSGPGLVHLLWVIEEPAWKQRHHWDVRSEKWQKTIAVLRNFHSPRRKQGLGINGKHRTGLTNKILGEPLRTGRPDFTHYITYLLAFLTRFWMLGTHISVL